MVMSNEAKVQEEEEVVASEASLRPVPRAFSKCSIRSADGRTNETDDDDSTPIVISETILSVSHVRS
jgi:hypothetical protein